MIIFFSASLFAQAPELKFKHITVADGLAQNTVNGILRDGRGFMWFGSREGLNKYDGYTLRFSTRFKRYDLH